MAGEPSKTQIDKLGERLKKGEVSADDLRLLDEYRLSFSGAFETVVGIIRDQLGLEPTGRPSKSTTSIAEKLRRESIRLTQIQDISGCRLVVKDLAAQDQVLESLVKLFRNATAVDRRKQPSYGYRAIHLIVNQENKLVEIQIRTALQHLWAELSEKLSDLIDPAIKYGGGDKKIQELLTESSGRVATQEGYEARVRNLNIRVAKLSTLVNDRTEINKMVTELDDIQKTVLTGRENLSKVLNEAKDLLPD